MITQLWIDLFCGAGGTTTGIETATFEGKQFAKVIACVNHDALAIASHNANHPETLHFTEDIRTLDLSGLLSHLEAMKARYPAAAVYLWASLECTNFSNAKGGLPRDADSRTLAEHLFRYIKAINPEYIFIENVREFMAWGPLNEKGKPISRDKGADYLNWVYNVKSFGYNYGFRLLNAADFGAYTNRVRYFGQFSKKVNTRQKLTDNYDPAPFVWPTPTHTKGGCEHLKPYKKVRDVLDLSDKGLSIFNRPKPLVESTLKRILAGLVKFVGNGKGDGYMCSYYGGELGSDSSRDLNQPCPTVVTRNAHSLVQPIFITKAFGGSPEGKAITADGPSGSITTKDHHQAVYVMKYYGNGANISSADEPCGTLTTKDRMAMVTTEPVLSNGQFLLNPAWFGDAHSTDKPSPTIVASQHKAPLSIAMCWKGKPVEVQETDCPTLIQIKHFCQAEGIADVSMRMLKVPELLLIQGFPKDYILMGSDAAKKKFIGNSVCPVVATALAVANRKVQLL